MCLVNLEKELSKSDLNQAASFVREVRVDRLLMAGQAVPTTAKLGVQFFNDILADEKNAVQFLDLISNNGHHFARHFLVHLVLQGFG